MSSTDSKGKVRVEPHRVGKWPCHVFIINKPNEESTSTLGPKKNNEAVTHIIEYLQRGPCPMILPEDTLHISLSKTFYAHHWHLDSISRALSDAVSSIGDSQQTPDTISFDGFSSFLNEEKTRSFLALNTDESTLPYLVELVRRIDLVLVDFGHPKYYKDPQFHTSFAWAPGDYITADILRHITDELQPATSEKRLRWKDWQIIFKAGDRLYKLGEFRRVS